VSVGTRAGDVARRPLAFAGGARTRALASPAIAAVGVLTALAAVLRFTRLGHQGFWYDEANTALLVQFAPGKMLGLIAQRESTPPLYYCLAWIWARVFGHGEAGLRSLSALAGVATVPVLYAAATKLISPRAGLLAAALAACDPLLIWYSQEARSYSLLVCLTAVALLAFAHARAAPRPRALLAWAIACALALATHYYALLVVVPQALWLLATNRHKRSVRVAIVAVAACGLALIPLAVSQDATGRASWIASIPLGVRLGQITPQFLIGFQAPAPGVLYPIAAAAAVLALLLLAARADIGEQRVGLVLGALALGGLALNLALIAVGVDDLLTRNMIALWVPAAVMVASGLGARRAGLLGSAGAVVLCAAGIIAAVGVAVDRDFQRPDWRVVAHVLGTRPTAGATGREILLQNYHALVPLSLYLPGLRTVPRIGESVSELDVISFSAPRVTQCWWGSACNLSPSSLQRSYPVPRFHEVWRRRALQFNVLRLVSSRPVALTPRTISRALAAKRLGGDDLLYQRS